MHLEQKAGLRSDKSGSQVPSIHLEPTPGTPFDSEDDDDLFCLFSCSYVSRNIKSFHVFAFMAIYVFSRLLCLYMYFLGFNAYICIITFFLELRLHFISFFFAKKIVPCLSCASRVSWVHCLNCPEWP